MWKNLNLFPHIHYQTRRLVIAITSSEGIDIMYRYWLVYCDNGTFNLFYALNISLVTNHESDFSLQNLGLWLFVEELLHVFVPLPTHLQRHLCLDSCSDWCVNIIRRSWNRLVRMSMICWVRIADILYCYMSVCMWMCAIRLLAHASSSLQNMTRMKTDKNPKEGWKTYNHHFETWMLNCLQWKRVGAMQGDAGTTRGGCEGGQLTRTRRRLFWRGKSGSMPRFRCKSIVVGIWTGLVL